MNTRNSSSAPTRAPAHSPTPAIEAMIYVLEVDYIVVVAATYEWEEPISPSISPKSSRDDKHQSPRGECSPKWTQVTEDDAYGEVTYLIKISYIFSS